jgi:hypothetical protein
MDDEAKPKKIGRKPGTVLSARTKAQISASLNATWSERKRLLELGEAVDGALKRLEKKQLRAREEAAAATKED